MFKKQHLVLAIAASLIASGTQALETSIVLKNETASMVKDGLRNGEKTFKADTTGEGKGVYKFENTAQFFLNDDIGENSSWHGEFKYTRDSKAVDGYDGHMNMSQQDYLRELYVDTQAGDWDLRIGKQQVVWGTADGIKLLDMINPTDFREFNQNAPADARIPVWMVNAEKYLDNGANVQVIASLAEKNVIPGLNASGDPGHPFTMMGVDSITGEVDGFLHVTPALAGVASTFDFAANNGGFATTSSTTSTALSGFTGLTVDGFANNSNAASGGGYYVVYDINSSGDAQQTGAMLSYGQQVTYTSAALASMGITTPTNFYTSAAGQTFTYKYDGTTITNASATSGTSLLYGMAENGATGYTTYANNGVTNLTDPVYSLTVPDAAFEYMPMATFATFNTFAEMTTKYISDDSDKTRGNLAFRFKNTTANGLNYSFNYAYRADSNPYIDLYYRDKSSGERLSVEYVKAGNAAGLPVSSATASGVGTVQGTLITADQIPTTITSMTYAEASAAVGTDLAWYYAGQATNAVTTLVRDSAGHYYGKRAWGHNATVNPYNDIEMVFEEKANRVHNIGGSFDFAFDTEATPVVIRGEWLYTKDEMTPVIDKRILAVGDLANSLTMRKADTFKYVIGADVNVLTDMMVSGQFIQIRNLDYVDTQRTCTTQLGSSVDCSTYTADMATLSMSNQMQRAEENKEFYTLFLSKPFGDSGEGRWNNIFLYEEGGGKWNRFDVEYGISDQLIGTLEYNKYFGDKNTTFGQMENASNIQIGLKYLLQ